MVIKEYGPGNVYMGSKYFDTTPAGYMAAQAEIKRIIDSGHRPDGDVAKAMNYRP